jgi:hypothetical protein
LGFGGQSLIGLFGLAWIKLASGAAGRTADFGEPIGVTLKHRSWVGWVVSVPAKLARGFSEARRSKAAADSPRTWIEDEQRVVMTGLTRYEIPLNEIVEVVAFKADCISIDTVCVEIVAGGLHYETNEDCQGFWTMVDELLHILQGDAEWRDKVVLPGFEECRTVVYRRGGASREAL